MTGTVDELIREPGLAPYRRLWCAHGLHWVTVVELAQGARTDDEHLHIDADTFKCGRCMERAGEAKQIGVAA